MKLRLLIFLYIFLMVFTGLNAQQLVVQNDDDRVLFCFVGSGDVVATIDRLPKGDVAAAINAYAEKFISVAPGNASVIDTMNGEEFGLLGFYITPGSNFYQIVVQKFPPLSATTTYSISKENILLDENFEEVKLFSWEVEFTKPPIVLDNRFVDWLKVDELTSFSESFLPERISQEENNRRLEIKASESLFWNNPGTSLNSIKSIRHKNTLYFYINSMGGFSSSVSYFAYFHVHPDKDEDSTYTIEIPLNRSSGPVLLWVAGKTAPEIAGDYVYTGSFLEARIQHDIISGLMDRYEFLQFDFTSAYFQEGRYEEFFLADIFLNDISVFGM